MEKRSEALEAVGSMAELMGLAETIGSMKKLTEFIGMQVPDVLGIEIDADSLVKWVRDEATKARGKFHGWNVYTRLETGDGWTECEIYLGGRNAIFPDRGLYQDWSDAWEDVPAACLDYCARYP